MNLIIALILPAAALLAVLFFEKKPFFCRIISLAAAILSSGLACSAAFSRPHIIFPWLGGVLDFSLRIDTLAAGMLLLVSMLSSLAFIYAFVAKMPVRTFRVLLLMQIAAAGAAAADSLAALAAFAGIIPMCMYNAPLLSENKNENRQGSGQNAGRKELMQAAADAMETKREKSLAYWTLLLVLIMSGISITCYISGTMNIAEISMAKLTLDYAWAVSAFILVAVPVFSITGIFPFSFRASENLSRPLWFRAYASALFLTLGISMLIRFSGFVFKPGETACAAVFWLGAATGLAGAFSAFAENSLRRLPAFIIQAQIGIMLCGLSADKTMSGGLIHIFMLVPAGFALTMLAGFAEKQAGTDDLHEIEKIHSFRHKMPFTAALFLLYSLSFAALPPFGDSFRLILAGMLPQHPVFFITVCLVQILIAAAMIKINFVFLEGNENCSAAETGNAAGSDEEKTNGRMPRDPSVWNLIIAGIPFLVLLAAGFGACMPEQLFAVPVMEAMDIKTAVPAHSSALLYISQLIVFLSGCLVYQAGNAIAGKGPASCSDFISGTSFFQFFRKIMLKNIFDPVFSFFACGINNPPASKTGAVCSAAYNSAAKLVWDLPAAALKKTAALFSPAAESSLNFSMAAALIFAAALIIAAAAGGFN